MAHTDGPWRIGNLESYDAYTGKPFRNVWTANDTCIARAIDNGDVDANASLIAAAPRMLAALEDIAEDIPYHTDHETCECSNFLENDICCHVKVFQAIRAAKGE